MQSSHSLPGPPLKRKRDAIEKPDLLLPSSEEAKKAPSPTKRKIMVGSTASSKTRTRWTLVKTLSVGFASRSCTSLSR